MLISQPQNTQKNAWGLLATTTFMRILHEILARLIFTKQNSECIMKDVVLICFLDLEDTIKFETDCMEQKPQFFNFVAVQQCLVSGIVGLYMNKIIQNSCKNPAVKRLLSFEICSLVTAAVEIPYHQ